MPECTSLFRSQERPFSGLLTIVKGTWVSNSRHATCVQLSRAISSAIKKTQKYSGTSRLLEETINIQFHHPTAVFWFASKWDYVTKWAVLSGVFVVNLSGNISLSYSKREIPPLNIVELYVLSGCGEQHLFPLKQKRPLKRYSVIT